MARNHSIFLLTLAAVSADVGEVAGHVGERLIPINYLSEETLARLDFDDATVEDWIDSVGEPSLTPLDFFLWSHPSLPSLSDRQKPSLNCPKPVIKHVHDLPSFGALKMGQELTQGGNYGTWST